MDEHPQELELAAGKRIFIILKTIFFLILFTGLGLVVFWGVEFKFNSITDILDIIEGILQPETILQGTLLGSDGRLEIDNVAEAFLTFIRIAVLLTLVLYGVAVVLVFSILHLWQWNADYLRHLRTSIIIALKYTVMLFALFLLLKPVGYTIMSGGATLHALSRLITLMFWLLEPVYFVLGLGFVYCFVYAYYWYPASEKRINRGLIIPTIVWLLIGIALTGLSMLMLS